MLRNLKNLLYLSAEQKPQQKQIFLQIYILQMNQRCMLPVSGKNSQKT